MAVATTHSGLTKLAQRRLVQELRMLEKDPPFGIAAWLPCEQNYALVDAHIRGPPQTPYEEGLFSVQVRVPAKYPFCPPQARFRTTIYHPNIDSGGRICLDLLKMPPKGSWKPSLNLSSLLVSIQQLLAEPNPDDGLVRDITLHYRRDLAGFNLVAKEWTLKYATSTSKATLPSVESGGARGNDVAGPTPPPPAPPPPRSAASMGLTAGERNQSAGKEVHKNMSGMKRLRRYTSALRGGRFSSVYGDGADRRRASQHSSKLQRYD